MKADEATSFLDSERTADRFKQRAAIAIAVLAMLLAVTGLGGQNATKEALNSNVQASDLYSFYQAKSVRQTSFMLAADALEFRLAAETGLAEGARESMRAKADQYRKIVVRYESEPDTQEGKKELLARAKVAEGKRDHALKQDPYFDYAEALLQIAIVLISVAIVAEVTWLALLGGGLGVLGALLMMNGYVLLVDLPFLG